MPSKLHVDPEVPQFPGFLMDNFTYPEEFLRELPNFNRTLQLPSNDSYDLYTFQRIVNGMNIFITPIIIAIGVVGNTLSFVVFTATHLRFQSASIYLAFLNLVDTIFLLCVFVTWFRHFDIHLLNINGICQTVAYLSYISSFLSVYTVVSFTAERWIIVYKPLHKSSWCTRKHALIVICSLTVGALLLYSFSIWTMVTLKIPQLNGGHASCMLHPKYHQLEQILSTIDTVITLIIPSIVIIVLNIGVTLKIWQFVYKRNMGGPNSFIHDEASFMKYPIKGSFVVAEKKATEHTPSGVMLLRKVPSLSRQHSAAAAGASISQSRGALGRYLNQTACSRNHMQLRTTRALLIVSSVFVVLNFPSHVFRTHVSITSLTNKLYVFPRNVMLWQHIFQILYYANFAVNFFLYSACSRTFRSAFKRLYEKVKRKFRNMGRKMGSLKKRNGDLKTVEAEFLPTKQKVNLLIT